jgi:hypothetical protein
MLALLGDGAEQACRQRRDLDALQLGLHPLAEEAPQPALVDRRQRLRQHPHHEGRERRTALPVAQPGRHLGGEVDLAELRLDRLGSQEIGLDEGAEIVGDALVVARDDGGVRDRQAERPAEQRHHRVPVREAADRRGRGEGGDVPPAQCIGSKWRATTNRAAVETSSSVAASLMRARALARSASRP